MSSNPGEIKMPASPPENTAGMGTGMPKAAEITIESLSAPEALEMLGKNPVGFVQQIVAGMTEKYLADLKEQAELRGALNAFRKAHPEAVRFEPFILQEVVALIQNDPDGVIDPWDKLLEKALKAFSTKFEATVKDELAKGDEIRAEEKVKAPFVEGAANRVMPELPPSFTRAQIAAMSQAEFLKNEAAINEALKNNRIR